MKRTANADRLTRSEQFAIFTRPQRSWPARVVGLLVRLRAEIAVVVVTLTAWWWLADRMPTWAAALVLGVPALGAALLPWSRRYLGRRVLAVLTRHRLRAVFVERRVMNCSGNVPILLWSRPTPIGERVWLVLRAGIDTVDIGRELAHVASGCHARSARVTARRSITSLATVDVIRRDPLTTALRRAAPEPADVVAEPTSLHVVPDLRKGA